MSLSTYNQRYSTSDTQSAGVFAFDTIGGTDYAISKLGFGALGSITYVSAADPLPVTISGVATAANQSTANTALAAIQTAVEVLDNIVSGSEAQVDVVAALPAGTNNIGDVDVLTVPADPFGANADAASATGSISAKLRYIASTGIPVTGTVAVTQSGTWDEVGINDSGNSITVDAPVGTPVFVRLSDGSSAISTLPVSLASVPSHEVTNAGTFPVQVDGSALTALQLLDNSVVVLGTDTYTEATSSAYAIGAVRRDADTTLVNTTNEWGPLQMDANGRLKVEAFSGETLAVSLTSTTITGTVAVTQSGTWDEVGINDSGNSITVDDGGTTLSIDDGAGSITVDNGGTFAVQAVCTNAGTFAVQESGGSLTALQLIDDTIVTLGTDTYTEATSKGQIIAAVRRDADTPLANTTNEYTPLITDANGYLKVEIFDGGGSHTVDNNGTFAVQAAQSGTWNVGTVTTVTTVSAVTTCSTLTGGGVAHDGVDSGNPHKIGAKAETSPKGITLVADADRTDLFADCDGMLMIKQNTSNDDVISERVSNTDGASTASSGFAAVANTHNCITAFQVFRTDAGTTPIYIDFRDGTAGAILWSAVIPAGGGSNSPSCCGPFLFRTSQNTALAYDVSAATTTVYISVSGYQSKS